MNFAVPTIFLSLAGDDDAAAEEIWKQLPRGLADYYRKSFDNGATLLAEMERLVDNAAIFVLLASAASTKSPWVGFELAHARIREIVDPLHRILIFPIDDVATIADLPEWMRAYWVPGGTFGPKDIGRHVLHVLLQVLDALYPEYRAVIGRGQLLDRAVQQSMNSVLATNQPPNVFLLAGINQIGRRSFSRVMLKSLYPSLPNIDVGPTLVLPLFSDIVDLYKGLRAQIVPEDSLDKWEADLAAFGELEMSAQVEEVIHSLDHFGHLQQAITIVIGQGLFNADGNAKPWFEQLIARLATQPDIILVLITFRQMREETLIQFPNCIQLLVPPLSNPDVRALVTLASKNRLSRPIVMTDSLLTAVGGHPVVARSVVRLAEQRGFDVVEKQSFLIFGIQEQLLSENLAVEVLDGFQLDLLAVLSWVPALDGNTLLEILKVLYPDTEDRLTRGLEELILVCLAQVSDNGYSISAAVRSMFRRKHGFGGDALVEALSKVLKDRWEAGKREGVFHPQLLDAFIFMVALEGKSLPPELRRLISPAALEEVIRETYARGKREETLLRQVVNWGAAATDMQMDEATREQILSLVFRAHIRLRDWEQAERFAGIFKDHSYRSRFELIGFMNRRAGKLDDAIWNFREALRIKPRDRSVIQELATCYVRKGDTKKLDELLKNNEEIISRNAILLDFKIGVLISRGTYGDAEIGIRALGALPDNEGRSIIRQSQLDMQRDHDFQNAYDALSRMVETNVGDMITVRRWRSIAAGRLKKYDEAQADIDFVGTKVGGDDTARRLRVRLEVSRGQTEAARRHFQAIKQRSSQDDLLEASLLEKEAQSTTIGLAERERKRVEATRLRDNARGIDEFQI